MNAIQKLEIAQKSVENLIKARGFFGHAGRPGQRGGSSRGPRSQMPPGELERQLRGVESQWKEEDLQAQMNQRYGGVAGAAKNDFRTVDQLHAHIDNLKKLQELQRDKAMWKSVYNSFRNKARNAFNSPELQQYWSGRAQGVYKKISDLEQLISIHKEQNLKGLNDFKAGHGEWKPAQWGEGRDKYSGHTHLVFGKIITSGTPSYRLKEGYLAPTSSVYLTTPAGKEHSWSWSGNDASEKRRAFTSRHFGI